jgi:ATP-dependent RNA helicase DeaD
MDQNLRNAVITKFKNKEFGILVATDVAARGIDVSGLTHVINFSLPEDQESYVHRIGRTGRAGKEGTAITFVGRGDVRKVQQLARRFNAVIKQLEVPRIADIMEARALQATTYLQSLSASAMPGIKSIEAVQKAVVQFSQGELANLCTKLLVDKFLKGYEHEQDVDFAPVSEDSRVADDKQEIMLHIGSEDGVTRQDIVHYCKVDGIDQRSIERIRVINKRSFIVVPARVAPLLVEQLKQKRILGKKVRVIAVAGEVEGPSKGRHGGRRDGSRGRFDRERRRY